MVISRRKALLLSLPFTLTIWLAFSWPLARYATKGIPSSSSNIEKYGVRRMISGDHLQMLYHYWLFADMVAGKTPFFYNLYEFNCGNDEERRFIGFDSMPFILVFAAANAVAGRAAAWNLTGFFSLWWSYVFTYHLLRRYVRNGFPALIAALIGVALPYQWTSLLGGSPTGFALALVPMFLWGIDGLVRRGDRLSGLVAALAITLSYCNDVHVFFFSLLVSPFWALIALLHAEGENMRDRRFWRRRILAGLALVGTVIVLAAIGYLKHTDLAASPSVIQHRWEHLGVYSPGMRGILAWRTRGKENSVYVGAASLSLLGAAWLQTLAAFRKERAAARRRTAAFVLMLCALGGIVVLAFGTNGPLHGKLFAAARRFVPGYEQIRQPTKVFILFPAVFAVALSLAVQRLTARVRNRRVAAWLAAAALAVVLVDHAFQVRASVCLLDEQQPAYEAVARDARSVGKEPRVLIIPIWPGNSAWASLYEHYVSLYRIRMINGYQPVVPESYITDIFSLYDSVTTGLISDAHFEDMKSRGIRYVILHEDAFPEKVSCFPVAFTLKRLLSHPRLELLCQAANIWAFKVRDVPASEPQPGRVPDWDIFFPTLWFEAETAELTNAASLSTNGCSGGMFARLETAGAAVALPAFGHAQAPSPGILARCRGHGRLNVAITPDGGITGQRDVAVESAGWEWIRIALGDLEGSGTVTLAFRLGAGAVDLDVLSYWSGDVPRPPVGESLSLPAPLFFHAGHTDLHANGVRFRWEYERSDAILYGPRIPLPVGCYDVEMAIHSTARPGTHLGRVIWENGNRQINSSPVVAGQPYQQSLHLECNLPSTMHFVYSRNADMMLGEVLIRRRLPTER